MAEKLLGAEAAPFLICTCGLQASRVRAAHLTWANRVFSAFLPFSRINNLRRFSGSEMPIRPPGTDLRVHLYF